MGDKFSDIKNEELQKLLKYVGEDPVFFYDEMRLLSEDEILNYKEELEVNIDNIIPLIDLYDNDFLVYDLNENIFKKMNIVDGAEFDKTNTIKDYLELLSKYK